MLYLVMVCGVLALVYGVWARGSILSASAGSERMQEISAAVQEGARAYLSRQYRTIAIVGVAVAAILYFVLGPWVAGGFVVGGRAHCEPPPSSRRNRKVSF